jgi:hypothetical protein
MGLFEDSKDASKWKSEYDDHAADVTKAEKAPAAGMISLKDSDIPSFFAWADQEQNKQRFPG